MLLWTNEAQSFPKAVKAVFPSYYEKEKGEALKGPNNQPIKHLDGIVEVFFFFFSFSCWAIKHNGLKYSKHYEIQILSYSKTKPASRIKKKKKKKKKNQTIEPKTSLYSYNVCIES
jgi:hypothetical protein